jgi:hypothetical protein
MTQDSEHILTLLAEAKRLAREYQALTGKPLGITGEVAEYEAARILNLQLTPARTAGYDAIRTSDGHRYQIKGRCLLPGCKPGQRMGRINTGHDFDSVLLVLMDEQFNALEIYEADREPVRSAGGSWVQVPQSARRAGGQPLQAHRTLSLECACERRLNGLDDLKI